MISGEQDNSEWIEKLVSDELSSELDLGINVVIQESAVGGVPGEVTRARGELHVVESANNYLQPSGTVSPHLVNRRWGTEARRASVQQMKETRQTLARSERGKM